MHGTSPARLCEDVTSFSGSQHYANRPRRAHAPFGLLIITCGHPGLRDQWGQNTDERPL